MKLLNLKEPTEEIKDAVERIKTALENGATVWQITSDLEVSQQAFTTWLGRYGYRLRHVIENKNGLANIQSEVDLSGIKELIENDRKKIDAKTLEMAMKSGV